MLKESEDIFRLIADSAKDIISIFDSNLKLIYINEVQQKISGFSRKEVMGKSPIEFMHPDDINRCIKIFQKTFKTGEGFGEFRLRRKNGSYVWLEVNAKIIIDKKGETKAILISRDINKRKLMEDKLKKSEEKYRQLFENSPFGIILIDQQGIIINCNPACEKFIGYEKGELIGKKYSDLSIVHPKYLPILLKRLKEIVKKENLPSFDIKINKKDGTLMWGHIQSSLIKVGDEIFIQVIGIDITTRKKAEKKLKESEEKFRKIFESIPDIFFLVSADTTILDFKYKDSDLRIPNEILIGRKLTKIVPKDLVELTSDMITKTIETRIPHTIEFSIPSISQIRYFEARYLFFSEKQIAIFVREITKRKKAEILKMEETKKLKELDKIRKNLIASISHELKTPLMLISGTTELLTNFFNKQIRNDALELIKILEKGEKRLSYLVDNLLDISKLEFKKLELNSKKENLSDVILKCSNEMKFFMKERDIELNLNLPEVIFLEIDKLRMEQVILNILSNAIKNTPPKGKISVSLQLQNNDAILIISDTGVGMTKGEINKLFTRFGKLERHEEGLEYVNIQGAGLGLFISKELIELHGGKISVNSKGRNKGSCFMIKLPLRLT